MLEIKKAVTGILAIGLLAPGCSNEKQKMAERKKAVDEVRASDRRAQTDKPANPAPPAAPAALGPPWEDSTYIRLGSDAPCPADLFPAKATKFNADYANSTFLVVLSAPVAVKLGEYDIGKGFFPVEVAGSIDCKDSAGSVTIAWTAAQATTPPPSPAQQDSEVQMRVWSAPPLAFQLPMASMDEAKTFAAQNRFGLKARLLLKLERAQVDKKLVKVQKVQEKDITIGGGNEDWGAGRLIRARILGTRLATDQERKVLIERAPIAGQ